MCFWWRGSTCTQACIIPEGFCWSQGAIVIMKGFSAFLDKRWYKNWPHKKNNSWKYLSEDLSCRSSPSSPHSQHPLTCHLTPAEHRVPHFCSTLESFQGMLKISNCSSTWFDSCRGKWQVPICSWQPLEEALKFQILSLFSPSAPTVSTHLPPYLRNCCSVAQSCPTVWDPMDCSTPGFPVLHYLLEFAQNHVHWVGDAIQSSCPLSSPSPPAVNLSQHQGLSQWIISSHQVAKVLELQHQSFQWIF